MIWKYNASASEVGADLVGDGSVLRHGGGGLGAAGESGSGQEGRQGGHLRNYCAAGYDPYRKGIRGQIRAQGRILAGGRHQVIDRVLTEWRAGKPGFDIVIGARGALLLGKEENIYAKFVPTNTCQLPFKVQRRGW